MIHSITIVTGQGVKTYKSGGVIPETGKKIDRISYSPAEGDSIYQMISKEGRVLAEIINCPVEVIWI